MPVSEASPQDRAMQALAVAPEGQAEPGFWPKYVQALKDNLQNPFTMSPTGMINDAARYFTGDRFFPGERHWNSVMNRIGQEESAKLPGSNVVPVDPNHPMVRALQQGPVY